MSERWVDDLKPGDRFEWCGRVVELYRIESAMTYRRGRSRRLHVRLGEEHFCLHYYDDEVVTVPENQEAPR